MIVDKQLYNLADSLGMQVYVMKGDKLRVKGTANIPLLEKLGLRLTVKPKIIDYRIKRKTQELVVFIHLRGDLYMLFSENTKKGSVAISFLDGKVIDKKKVFEEFKGIPALLEEVIPLSKASFAYTGSNWERIAA